MLSLFRPSSEVVKEERLLHFLSGDKGFEFASIVNMKSPSL